MDYRLKMTCKTRSDSPVLINEHDVESFFSRTATKDLFDQLIEENSPKVASADEEGMTKIVEKISLSPKQSHQGCKCAKIDCLKMYCECFAKGKICSVRCQCVCCCNKADNEAQIFKARQMANFRHPGTFKGIPAFVPLKRCTCKKSSCRKNYCECYRANMKCSEECECLECQNGKPHHHQQYLDSMMEIEVNA